MINPFFKNKGPYKIDKLLKLSQVNNIKNFIFLKLEIIGDFR